MNCAAVLMKQVVRLRSFVVFTLNARYDQR